MTRRACVYPMYAIRSSRHLRAVLGRPVLINKWEYASSPRTHSSLLVISDIWRSIEKSNAYIKRRYAGTHKDGGKEQASARHGDMGEGSDARRRWRHKTLDYPVPPLGVASHASKHIWWAEANLGWGRIKKNQPYSSYNQILFNLLLDSSQANRKNPA
jgi:hypothetical protein